ncbi:MULTISPECIES: TetR-like C-terminal domain-containing protein [unclassified Nocardia]|uniref:TetR-like C-terminal domain-containing protein n=1 Tax=unclassified Nocardia TaxID=2637762 RepID=UPI0033B52F23
MFSPTIRGSTADNITPVTDDPERDLAALGSAYLANALASPDLYRVMFDAGFALEDATAADATLDRLVTAAAAARAAGRFHAEVDPLELATQSWTFGHGLAGLVATGPLPPATLDSGIPVLTALFVAAGDEPARCAASVAAGWHVTPVR